MPVLKKGSKQAKDYMAKIRAMKGTKKVVKSNKKVGEVYYYGDGKKVNLSDLKEGNIFEWIMGAGYIEVEYIGLKRNYPNIQLSSSVGINPTYLFKFTDDNRYTAMSMSAIKEYLRTIPKNSLNGYKKGSTRFIEQNEKPIKNARNYRVTRNKTTLLTKGGTFKNFSKIGAIDLNIIGKELMELESDINELKNFIQREKLIKEKNRLKDILKVKNNQFKTLKMYLNSIAQFTYKKR